MFDDFDFGSLFGDASQYAEVPDFGSMFGDASQYAPEWVSGGDIAGSGDGLPPWLRDTDGSDWANGGNNPGSGDLTTPGLGSGGGGQFRIPSPGGSSGSSLASMASRLFSGGSEGGGMGGLMSLLPLLASVYGGINSRNAAEDGARQLQEGADKANDEARGLIGGAAAGYKPYMDAGTGALAKLQSMAPSNLAAQFRPIGSGRGLNLSQIAKKG